jgi:selenide,water dikinase
MSPQRVAQLLRHLPKFDDPRLLVGPSSLDDAGVYQLDDDLALVQTVDMLTPIVDDPYDYGRIVAANCLSDAYAMGARPLTVLNIVCFPAKLDIAILTEILRGGCDIIRECGALLIGGHSMYDEEIKYGLAVTALARPQDVLVNAAARPSDLLVLTKPLGTGLIGTAIKAQQASRAIIREATAVMTRLNKHAAHVMQTVGVHALTDITGFGLLGHAAEIAQSSHATLRIRAGSVPLIQGTIELAQMDLLPAGSVANREYALTWTKRDKRIDALLFDVLVDAQTSGGLLASVDPAKADALVRKLRAAGDKASAVIGEVIPRKRRCKIELVP